MEQRPPLRLLGAGEIQDLFGVGRIRTYQITCRTGFPKPVAELESGRIWRAEDIEDWIRIHRPWNTIPAVPKELVPYRPAPIGCVTDLNRIGRGWCGV